MICRPCGAAGVLNAEGDTDTAADLHGLCEYPKSCSCQHRLGEGHVAKNEAGN
jgi:hypothetical protein